MSLNPTERIPSVGAMGVALSGRSKTSYAASAALVLATTTWGAAFPVAKFVLDTIDPLTMTLLRYGPAALIFLALLAFREGSRSLRPEGSAWRLVGLGTLGFGGFNILMFYGVNMSRPEFGAIVMALQPLTAAFVHAARTGSRPTRRNVASLLIALVGVVLLTTNGDIERLSHHAAVIPTLMMVAGGACWVLYSMGASAFPTWSALRYTALTSTGGTVSLALIWAVVGTFGGVRLPPAATVSSLVPAMLFLSLVAAVFAVLCWNQGLRSVGAQRGMLFINIVPLTALILGVLRGHLLGVWELAGVAMVLLSLFLNQLRHREARKSTADQRAFALKADCAARS